MRLETTARRIMRKLKGWSKKDQDADYRNHPKAHIKELQWLIKELEAVPKPPKKGREWVLHYISGATFLRIAEGESLRGGEYVRVREVNGLRN